MSPPLPINTLPYLPGCLLTCAGRYALRLCVQDANQTVPEALTKFGTHVKKKEHKLYGAFAKDVDVDKKSTKIKFEDSDDD